MNLRDHPSKNITLPSGSNRIKTKPTITKIMATYQGIHSYQVKVIFKLLLQVIVSSLWRERNARIFRNVSLTPLAFFKLVDRSLRDRLLSITRDPSQALSLLQKNNNVASGTTMENKIVFQQCSKRNNDGE
ncbi:hypothetical protein YC2023_028267 [Brassica napus]